MPMCAVLALNMIQEQEMTDSGPKCQLLKLRLPAVSSVTTISWKHLMDKAIKYYTLLLQHLAHEIPYPLSCDAVLCYQGLERSRSSWSESRLRTVS